MSGNLSNFKNSKRRPGPNNERSLGMANPHDKISFVIALRRNPEHEKELKEEIFERIERRQPHMTREEHHRNFGANDEEKETVKKYYLNHSN